MPGTLREMHPPSVVQGADVPLEVFGEAPVGRCGGAGAGPGVLGDKTVGAFALRDVEPHGGHALHALAEDAGHEHRVVADVTPHRDLVLGLKAWRFFLPDDLDVE